MWLSANNPTHSITLYNMKIEAQKKQQKPKYPSLAKTVAAATATAAALSTGSCLQQQQQQVGKPFEILEQVYGGVK